MLIHGIHTNLLIHPLLNVLEFLLQFFYLSSIWSCTVGLENLDITVARPNRQPRISSQKVHPNFPVDRYSNVDNILFGKRHNLFLFLLVVGKLLLILLPVLARGAGHDGDL